MSTIAIMHEVAAPASAAWKLLLHRIKHPEDYTQGIESVEMLSQEGGTYIRKIETANGQVTERIVVDESEQKITYFLVKHPFFQGHTEYKVDAKIFGDTDVCGLLIFQDWTAKKPHFDFEEREEVLHGIMEELCKRIEAEQ